MKKFILRIIGAWRYFWRLCPLCNSDAPELYTCPVCEYNHAPREFWKQRYIAWLYGESMPTFRDEEEKYVPTSWGSNQIKDWLDKK